MNEKIVCPIMHTIAMVSDKWKVLILYQLRDGKRRFNELRRALQGVTQRVLTHQLRALESDGLVKRTIFPEVPPRVEYELTELGRTLIPVLDQFEQWARTHSTELMQYKKNGTKCKGFAASDEAEIESDAELRSETEPGVGTAARAAAGSGSETETEVDSEIVAVSDEQVITNRVNAMDGART